MFEKFKNAIDQRVQLFQSLMVGVSKGQSGPGDIIGALIAIVIGVSLYPVVQEVIADVNASGTVAILLDLVPLLYVIGVIVGAIAWMGLHRL